MAIRKTTANPIPTLPAIDYGARRPARPVTVLWEGKEFAVQDCAAEYDYERHPGRHRLRCVAVTYVLSPCEPQWIEGE